MNDNIKNHQKNLAGFIDTVTRYDIRMMYGEFIDGKKFPFVLDYINNGVAFYEEFRDQLRIEVDKPENGKAFEIDLKDRFFPMIDGYLSWYEQHKHELEKFGELNFYEVLYKWAQSTKREIEKYYPSQSKNLDDTINHKLIAFAYHEAGKQIDSQNMNKIASMNGWISPHSGTKIKNLYNKFITDKVLLNEFRGKYTSEDLKKVRIL